MRRFQQQVGFSKLPEDFKKEDYSVFHHGFDIVIIDHKKTKQQLCVAPKVMGLSNRKRFKR